MPTEERGTHTGVIARLLAQPFRFEFFQAVRLLAAYFRRRSGDAALGQRIRFRSSLSLAFPPSEIEALQPRPGPAAGAGRRGSDATLEHQGQAPDALGVVEITPSFIGLTGNQGTLPRWYTELLIERETLFRDRAGCAFLDIFANRAIALYYQAWEKHRLHLQYERDRRERFLPLVLALMGLGSESLHERLRRNEHGVLDESLAYYCGQLRLGPRSASAIARVVGDYFAAPVKLVQFVGRWFDLAPGEETALGGPRAVLGQGALCGNRVWQRDIRMRLEIGPLSRERFDELLPQGRGAEALAKLLGMLTGPTMEYEVRLVLDRSQIGEMALGAPGAPEPRLGWDSWLATRPVATERDDAAYEIVPA